MFGKLAYFVQSGATINFLDKAIVNCASMLEEAWKWGFDVDVWRAHLNYATWPEILRQLAILWGLGPKRPKPKRELRPKMGTEGEDLKADEQGGLKLRLPPRLGIGTVKAAAWQVNFILNTHPPPPHPPLFSFCSHRFCTRRSCLPYTSALLLQS